MKRAAFVVVVLGLAAGGTWALTGRARPASGDEPAPVAATARVERRDLVERVELDGTLGFDDERPLLAGVAGTLTAIAPEGRAVRRGGVLYRLDGTAVRLLYGRVPAWRPFELGMTGGVDVRQLERNLRALGYDPGTVDRTFTSFTASAIRAWQDDLGRAETGRLDARDVTFSRGARRIGAHEVSAGSGVGPGSIVMQTTSLRRIVTIDLDALDRSLVSRGDRVEAELPSGRVVRGRIARIGRVATVDQAEDGFSDGTATIEVVVGLREEVRGLDRAPVDVFVAGHVERDVLAVPIPALLARAEGGYAVEAVDGAARRLVPVEIGGSADGWVAVSGPGVRAGMTVAVPR